MDWIVKILENSKKNNTALFVKCTKVAIYITIASVLFELGNGKYHILNIKDPTLLIEYFENGMFWLSFLYFIYAYAIFGILNVLYSFATKGIGKLMLRKQIIKIKSIIATLNEKNIDAEEFRKLFSFLDSEKEITPDNATIILEITEKNFETLKEVLVRANDIVICLLLLQFAIIIKHFPTPFIWPLTYGLGLFTLSLFSAFLSGIYYAGMISIPALKKVVEKQNSANH
jgi:hypothetical protein